VRLGNPLVFDKSVVAVVIMLWKPVCKACTKMGMN
jgi:hypothetical protein